MDEIKFERWDYFSTPVYIHHNTDFLKSVKSVSKKYYDKIKRDVPLNPIYPSYQTENFFHEEEISDFTNFILNQSWNILYSQGYHMDDKEILFDSMWLQHHKKFSSMEYHTHNYGVQLVGFYFLKCPPNSPRIFIHDNRAGKIQSHIPERDGSQLSDASSIINFVPQEGMLFITNSWVPHSFERNSTDEPFEFVHFNLFVNYKGVEQNTPIII